jgi:hypothetical protein
VRGNNDSWIHVPPVSGPLWSMLEMPYK